jgi:16S rRNA (uracil1498-N3)-methyltransferase
MEYFYTPPHLISAHELTIEGEEFSHLTHVMRKKAGDTTRVVDGAGTAYDVTIAEITRRTARCKITQTHPRLNEPAIDVILGVPILKNASKFDFLIEKVTELGVNTIVPLLTERTIPRHAKTDRWQKLALAAMKQSGRCVLPVVRELTRFDDFITSAPHNRLKLIPHEKADLPLMEVLRQQDLSSITMCIGPEGGFSDEEITLAQGAGFQPVSLGPRRLRTETAAIATVSAVHLQTERRRN